MSSRKHAEDLLAISESLPRNHILFSESALGVDRTALILDILDSILIIMALISLSLAMDKRRRI